MRSVMLVSILWVAFLSAVAACDRCGSTASNPERGGTVGVTAGRGIENFRWGVDVTYDYRTYERQGVARAHELHERGRDAHEFRDDWIASTRFSYAATKNLDVGVTQSYRQLRLINVHGLEHAEEPEDGEEAAPDPILGRKERSRGLADLEFDIRYRFKQQKEKGFPVDLAVFGMLKPPSGNSNVRNPSHERFEAEEQPGTGSWDGTLGLAASRQWGPWGSSGAVSYTYKGEGTQETKLPDVFRASLSASRQVAPACWGFKLYPALGVQGLFETKQIEHGRKSPDHGGQTIFVIPGLAAQPTQHITVGISAQVPVYQEMNGFHQKQKFGIQAHIGFRF